MVETIKLIKQLTHAQFRYQKVTFSSSYELRSLPSICAKRFYKELRNTYHIFPHCVIKYLFLFGSIRV